MVTGFNRILSDIRDKKPDHIFFICTYVPNEYAQFSWGIMLEDN